MPYWSVSCCDEESRHLFVRIYRRERVESQRLIAVVNLTDQLLSQKSAVRVLQADQMPLSAGNTVGIQPVTDEWRAGPSDGREAFPEIKPVIVVALAFIVLCDQLKLPGFIDVQRTSSHDVQPIEYCRPVWVLSSKVASPLPSNQPPNF